MAIPNLQEIVALARLQVHLMGEVEGAENHVKELKARLRTVQEEDLPAAMAEAGGLKKFVLDTGEVIDIKEDFVVGLTKENQEEGYDWLESHGFDGIIKTVVSVEFGKGELEKANKLLLELAKKKYNARLGRDVHWATLKALISEQIRAGAKVPMDLFGVRPLNKAMVKLSKS